MSHTPSRTSHTFTRRESKRIGEMTHTPRCVIHYFSIGPRTFSHAPSGCTKNNQSGGVHTKLMEPHTFTHLSVRGGDYPAAAGVGDNTNNPLAPTCPEEAEALKKAPPIWRDWFLIKQSIRDVFRRLRQ